MNAQKGKTIRKNCQYIYVDSGGKRTVVPGKTKLAALLKESGMFEVRICRPQEPLILKTEYRQHQDNPQQTTVLYFKP